MKTTQEKYNDLKEYLRSLGSVAVAFSSGVDSTFLLAASREVIGDQVTAVTAAGRSVPEWEIEEAREFCPARSRSVSGRKRRNSARRITSDRYFASQKSLISMDFEAIRRTAVTSASTNCLRKS